LHFSFFDVDVILLVVESNDVGQRFKDKATKEATQQLIEHSQTLEPSLSLFLCFWSNTLPLCFIGQFHFIDYLRYTKR